MFEATFRDLFRAIDRIESGLESCDDQQKQILTEELSLLRSVSDQYVEQWLQFEERVSALCDRFQLQLETASESLEWAAKWISEPKPKETADQIEEDPLSQLFSFQPDNAYMIQGLSNYEVAESFRSGLGYFDLLLFDQCIEQMERVLSLSPELTIARIYLALGYLAKGEHEKCRTHLQFVSLFESSPLLLATVAATRAQLAAREGNYEDALIDFRQAVKLEPDLKDAHYNIGVCEWHRQNYRDAVMALEKAVEVEPGDWQAYQLMGRAWIRIGRLDKAVHYLEKARQMNPAYPPLLLNLADVYQMVGRIADAGSLYERILMTDSFSVPALGGLGWIRMQEGRLQEAITLFQKQQQIKSTDESIYNLGCAYLADGDLESADQQFSRIRKKEGLEPFVCFAKTRILIKKGEFEQAKDLIAPFIESSSREIRSLALLSMGRVYCEWGQPTRAIRYLKLSLILKPDSPDAALLLGACYSKTGNEEEARKWMQHCQELLRGEIKFPAGKQEVETKLLN